MPNETDETFVIGVGGATCSGKTTLSKHLLRILSPDGNGSGPFPPAGRPPVGDSDTGSVTRPHPSSNGPGPSHAAFILHQDDFAPPEGQVPWNEKWQVEDWDTPYGSIDYDRMVRVLSYIRSHHSLPPDFSSHDHLNVLETVPLSPDVEERWREKFARRFAVRRRRAGKTTFVLADGFLLYWDRRVVEYLDVRLFLRVSREELLRRRENRSGYYTAVQSDPEGGFWKDPPQYFERIVWPAYEIAHSRILEGGDVEKGRVRIPSDARAGAEKEDGGPVQRLVLFQAEEMSMDDMVERACQEIWNALDEAEKPSE